MVTFFVFTLIAIFASYVVFQVLSYFNEKIAVASAILVFILTYVVYVWFYLNVILFNYTSETTAERGLFFKDTAILTQYKLVGKKDYIVFKLDEYSRSDRHLETILVKVNDKKASD